MSEDVRTDLTLLTVNLTPTATAALVASAKLTGDTRTDTVNRALLLYGQLIRTGVVSHFGRTATADWPGWDGSDEKLRIAVRTQPRRWWQRW